MQTHLFLHLQWYITVPTVHDSENCGTVELHLGFHCEVSGQGVTEMLCVYVCMHVFVFVYMCVCVRVCKTLNKPHHINKQ